MTDTSPVLALPYIQPSQAQKHVTHNEALRLLDAIVQLSVLSFTETTPPATSAEGDRYLVASNAEGGWAGHDHAVAVFVDGAWQFIAPMPGWVASVAPGQTQVVYDGARWAVPALQDVPRLGVGATPDAYNRLVVASDAVLFNNAGAGHQVKINKAAEGDTASLLFQTDFGGRAEMGTSGSDDFAIKVSADGANWAEALRIEAASGRVTAPISGWREQLAAARVYYVDPLQGGDGQRGRGTGAAAFASLGRAMEEVARLDSAGHAVTVQLADGSYDLGPMPVAVSAALGGGLVELVGNTGDPDAVTMTATGSVIELVSGRLSLRGMRIETSGADPAIRVLPEAVLEVDEVVFGTAGGHLDIVGGRVEGGGSYVIDGDAAYHLRLSQGAVLAQGMQTVTLANTPDFATAFVSCEMAGQADFSGHGFTGTATGKRFDVSSNSVVQSGGTVLPGDIAGTTQSGGLYL